MGPGDLLVTNDRIVLAATDWPAGGGHDGEDFGVGDAQVGGEADFGSGGGFGKDAFEHMSLVLLVP